MPQFLPPLTPKFKLKLAEVFSPPQGRGARFLPCAPLPRARRQEHAPPRTTSRQSRLLGGKPLSERPRGVRCPIGGVPSAPIRPNAAPTLGSAPSSGRKGEGVYVCFVSLLHAECTMYVPCRYSLERAHERRNLLPRFFSLLLYSDVSMLLLETRGSPPPLSPHGPKHWILKTTAVASASAFLSVNTSWQNSMKIDNQWG